LWQPETVEGILHPDVAPSTRFVGPECVANFKEPFVDLPNADELTSTNNTQIGAEQYFRFVPDEASTDPLYFLNREGANIGNHR
jgi:hypothetical protein